MIATEDIRYQWNKKQAGIGFAYECKGTGFHLRVSHYLAKDGHSVYHLECQNNSDPLVNVEWSIDGKHRKPRVLSTYQLESIIKHADAFSDGVPNIPQGMRLAAAYFLKNINKKKTRAA